MKGLQDDMSDRGGRVLSDWLGISWAFPCHLFLDLGGEANLQEAFWQGKLSLMMV